jgi:hypothetical protein
MKLPNKELRTFIYDRLNAAITYDTQVIPVNSIPAKGSVFSYILIGNISLVENSPKDRYSTLSTVEITVCSQSDQRIANYDENEEITNDLIGLLVDYIPGLTNYQMVWAHLLSSQEQTELTDTSYTINNILTFEYYLEQL